MLKFLKISYKDLIWILIIFLKNKKLKILRKKQFFKVITLFNFLFQIFQEIHPLSLMTTLLYMKITFFLYLIVLVILKSIIL